MADEQSEKSRFISPDTLIKNAAEQRGVLSRQHRRSVARMAKLVPTTTFRPVSELQTLVPSETIIDQEEDIQLYQNELEKYQAAQKLAQVTLRLYTFMRSYGADDKFLRVAFLGSSNPFQIRTITPQQHQKMLSEYRRQFGNKPPAQIAVVDEDDILLRKVLADTDIPTTEIIREGIRNRKETIELLQNQIQWLQDHEQRFPEIQEPQTTEPTSTQDGSAEIQIENPNKEFDYLLGKWEIYWTKVPWSSEPQHLVRIPTDNPQETINVIRKLVVGKASIKPGSIERALEFYLQPEVLDRARKAKLSYVPDALREWIKIKRGKDRMPLLVPEPGKAIFFISGRDDIYNSLP